MIRVLKLVFRRREPAVMSAFDINIGDGLADVGEAVMTWSLSTGYDPKEVR